MNRNNDYDEVSQGRDSEFDTSQQGGGTGFGQQGQQGQQKGGRMPKSQFPGGSDDTYGQGGGDDSYQQGDDGDMGAGGDSWNERQPQSKSGGGYGARSQARGGGQDYDPSQGGVGQYEEDDSARRQQKSGLLQGQDKSGQKGGGRFQEGESYMDEPSGEGFIMRGENQPSGGGQGEFGGFRE